jgi:uncharacterized repeat protein (TIGR01451 family)
MKSVENRAAYRFGDKTIVTGLYRFPVLLLAGVLLLVLAPGAASAQGDCPCTSPVASFPLVEDFEFENECALDDQCGLPCPLSGEWQNADDGAVDLDWTINAGATPTSGTGPLSDATLGTSSGKYAYTESSCSLGYPEKKASLLSPCLNVTSIGAPELSFSYHMFGDSMGGITVEASTNNCLSWTPLTTISGQQQTSSSAAWKNKVVNIIQYAGRSNLRLRIRGETGTSYRSDMAVDDLVIRAASCCDLAVKTIVSPISNCGLSSAETVTIELENFGSNNQTGFQVSYSIDGGPPVTETVTSTIAKGGTRSYSFNTKADLSAPGEHTISASVSLSGDTRSENDSLTATVVHVPTVAAYPYIEDFESGPGGWLSGGFNSTWALGTPNKSIITGAASGSSAWVTGGLGIGTYKNNEASRVLGPCMDLRTLPLPAVSFNVWWNSESTYDGAVLQYTIDGGITWQNVGAVGNPGNWFNQSNISGAPGGQPQGWSGSDSNYDNIMNGSHGWVSASNFMAGLAGRPDVRLRVAFGSDGIIPDDGFAFDDIVISNALSLTKTDAFTLDGGVGGRADVGDKIRYTIEIGNQSSAPLTSLIFRDTPHPNTSLIVGSVTTTQGTVTTGNGAGHTTVQVNLGTIAAGLTETITFEVLVKTPAAGSGTSICNQGRLSGPLFTNEPTDDPDQSGARNATCTPAYGDSDGDGVVDPLDTCPGHPDHLDADEDGVPDGCDGCKNDPLKIDPGACGCGVPDTDSDGDGTPDCIDGCPNDPQKTAPGVCGCGVADTDSDGDGTPNCNDGCPNDPQKTEPGVCGCGVLDTDSDGDGTPNCIDGCPNDPLKAAPGVCGCGRSRYGQRRRWHPQLQRSVSKRSPKDGSGRVRLRRFRCG